MKENFNKKLNVLVFVGDFLDGLKRRLR